MSARVLYIVGASPVVEIAEAVAASQRGSGHVRTLVLKTDQIASADLRQIPEGPTDEIEAFAAVHEAALNFARFDLWSKLKLKGLRCATLVHASAHVDASAKLGENALVGAGAIVEPRASVGRGTIVGAGAILGAGATLGDWCWLAQGVSIGSGSSIGSNTVLGSGVHFAPGTVFPGPGVVDLAGAYRGSFAPGTFVSPEFPSRPARMMSLAR